MIRYDRRQACPRYAQELRLPTVALVVGIRPCLSWSFAMLLRPKTAGDIRSLIGRLRQSQIPSMLCLASLCFRWGLFSSPLRSNCSVSSGERCQSEPPPRHMSNPTPRCQQCGRLPRSSWRRSMRRTWRRLSMKASL